MPTFSPALEKTLHRALETASERRHRYTTLEHLLYALTYDVDAAEVLNACGVDVTELQSITIDYINKELLTLKVPIAKPDETPRERRIRLSRPEPSIDNSNDSDVKRYNTQYPLSNYEIWKRFHDHKSEPTAAFQRVIQRAILHVKASGKELVTAGNVLVALFSERDSAAVHFLQQQDMSRLDAVSYLTHGIGKRSRKNYSIESDIDNDVANKHSIDDSTHSNTLPLQDLLNLRRVSHDVNVLDDRIPENPVLKTPAIALGIVDFINEVLARSPGSSAKPSPNPSFTFGIYGPWGSGKSTLLQSVKRHLESENGKIVQINAWYWDESTEFANFATKCLLNSAKVGIKNRIVVAFIQLTLIARSHYKRIIFGALMIAIMMFLYQIGFDWLGELSKEERERALLITSISLFSAILAKPIASLIEKFIIKRDEKKPYSSNSIYYSYLQFLTRIGPFRGRPVFFLVDDLDRCSPTKMINVIETIHFIVGSGNIAIIACDDKLISSAIYLANQDLADNAGEGRLFGERFLEKIVQVHFRMPDLDFGDLIELGLAQSMDETDENQSERVDKANQNEGIGSGSDSDDFTVRGQVKAEASHNAQGTDNQTIENSVDDIGISRISGDVLGEALKVYRIPVRKLKLLSNLIKLYTGIYKPDNAANAYRFITFIVMVYIDHHWLRTSYFCEENSDLEDQYNRIASFLGDSRNEVANLYPVLGLGSQFDKASERFQKFRLG